MTDLRYEHLFITGWGVGLLFMLAGVVAMWVYRVPGTTLSDWIDQPGHRVLFRHADALQLVRPEKRRLIYGLQLIGTTICCSLIIVPLLLSLFFPSAFE